MTAVPSQSLAERELPASSALPEPEIDEEELAPRRPPWAWGLSLLVTAVLLLYMVLNWPALARPWGGILEALLR